MSLKLANALQDWRTESPYSGESDWVFASWKAKGKRPREGGVMAADYLRPAAIQLGVVNADFKGRLGFHSFRHGLASALVLGGTDPKTVQGLLRHANVQTTLDLYCQINSTKALEAQEEMFAAMYGQPDGVTAA